MKIRDNPWILVSVKTGHLYFIYSSDNTGLAFLRYCFAILPFWANKGVHIAELKHRALLIDWLQTGRRLALEFDRVVVSSPCRCRCLPTVVVLVVDIAAMEIDVTLALLITAPRPTVTTMVAAIGAVLNRYLAMDHPGGRPATRRSGLVAASTVAADMWPVGDGALSHEVEAMTSRPSTTATAKWGQLVVQPNQEDSTTPRQHRLFHISRSSHGRLFSQIPDLGANKHKRLGCRWLYVVQKTN